MSMRRRVKNDRKEKNLERKAAEVQQDGLHDELHHRDTRLALLADVVFQLGLRQSRRVDLLLKVFLQQQRGGEATERVLG